MRLPPELIDLILNELRGDIPVLQACSKAHPILSHLVEQYLYASIVVHANANGNLAVSELHGRLSKNPHILDYPRTLGIHSHIECNLAGLTQDLLSIISMIPRMPNLTSLKLCEENGFINYRQPTDFLPAFPVCLETSSIEEVYLRHFWIYPLDVLDNCTNIKKLTLHNCLVKIEPIMNSPHQNLETLIIRYYSGPQLLAWASRRVNNLKSLQLRGLRIFPSWNWEGFPGLLSACSNSLTELHLDVGNRSQSKYLWNNDGGTGPWVPVDVTFPFTLSAHGSLKTLSIHALARSRPSSFECALPAIATLIKTSPALQDIDLHLHWEDSDLSSLGHFDWSRLVLDPSDFPSICPRIRLCNIQTNGGHSASREQMLNALAESEVLMGLVRRNAVILDPCPDHSCMETKGLCTE